jgi:hypothetical protein
LARALTVAGIGDAEDRVSNSVEVLKRLDGIQAESDRILALFDNGRVPQAKIREAQEMFRALKEKLHAEYKRMATSRGEGALSDVEARFYKPAIDDAWANTVIGNVRWNTYIRHWGGHLRSVEKA